MITDGNAARNLFRDRLDVPPARDLPGSGGPSRPARGARDESTAPPAEAPVTAPLVTERDQIRVRPPAAVRAFRAGSVLVTGDPLLDTAPPSVRALWRWHREQAAAYDGALWRHGREAWGVMDVTTTAVIYVLLWVKRHPAMTVLVLILVTLG